MRLRRLQQEPVLARRKGMSVTVRHRYTEAFVLRCKNAPVARHMEAWLLEHADRLQRLSSRDFHRAVDTELMHYEAAMWQAEKRVRGSRIPRYGGAY